MFLGGFSTTTGACPCCGLTVTRTHEWNGAQARDVYACQTCGTYRYGTVPALPTASLFAAAPPGLSDLLGHDNVVA